MDQPHQPPAAGPVERRVAVTVDLHEGDVPGDIAFAAEWLAAAEIPATFFVPSTMFTNPRYAPRLRELRAVGHEVGSHTHRHDNDEIDALIGKRHTEFGFLQTSRRIYEDFYGLAPQSFRSPGWCGLCDAALDELQRLGYTVDSSATPQRWSVLSSAPFRAAWTAAPRRPHYLRPGLLEVPTSTAAVPAGSPTFLIFRRTLSLALVRLFLAEARFCGDRVIVLQFHPEDFNPHSAQHPPCGRLGLGDFILRSHGGFGFKHHLKDTDHRRISNTTHSIVRLVSALRCLTLSEVGRLVNSTSLLRETLAPQRAVRG